MQFILFSQPPPPPSLKFLAHSSETSWVLANYYLFTYLQIASFPSFDILIPVQTVNSLNHIYLGVFLV